MDSDSQNAGHSAELTGLDDFPGGMVRDALIQTLLRKSLPDIIDKSRRFVPRSALFEVLSLPNVRQIIGLLLPDVESHTLNELAKYICPGESECSPCGRRHCTGGRVIFASLIWIAKHDLISSLLEIQTQVCDNDLPREATRATNAAWTTWQSQKMRGPELKLFDQVQLQLRAPFLELLDPQDATTALIEGAITLPWINYTTIHKPGPGNPCEVGEVHIHPAHHALVSLSSLSLLLHEQGV